MFTNFHSSNNWGTFRLSPVSPRPFDRLRTGSSQQNAKGRGAHRLGNAREIESLGHPAGVPSLRSLRISAAGSPLRCRSESRPQCASTSNLWAHHILPMIGNLSVQSLQFSKSIRNSGLIAN